MNKSLGELCFEATQIAVEHGFKDASIGEDIALMHSELSEALEDHRHGRAPNLTWYEDKEGIPYDTMNHDEVLKPCGIPSEMADTIIRILHFCGKHGIDIDLAVAEKMAYNASRPFKHGGKKL